MFLKHDGIFIFLIFLINFKHNKTCVYLFERTYSGQLLICNKYYKEIMVKTFIFECK